LADRVALGPQGDQLAVTGRQIKPEAGPDGNPRLEAGARGYRGATRQIVPAVFRGGGPPPAPALPPARPPPAPPRRRRRGAARAGRGGAPSGGRGGCGTWRPSTRRSPTRGRKGPWTWRSAPTAAAWPWRAAA